MGVTLISAFVQGLQAQKLNAKLPKPVMTNPRVGAQTDKSTRARRQHFTVLQVRTGQLARGISGSGRGLCLRVCLPGLAAPGRSGNQSRLG